MQTCHNLMLRMDLCHCVDYVEAAVIHITVINIVMQIFWFSSSFFTNRDMGYGKWLIKSISYFDVRELELINVLWMMKFLIYALIFY